MKELKIGQMEIGQTNCYFIYREGFTKVICVDPADYGKAIYEKMTEKGFTVTAVFLTHGHFDHICGVEELKKLTGCKIYALRAEKELLANPQMNLTAQVGRSYSLQADIFVNDNDTITLADMSCKVIATPGHTIGSCCYYFEEDGVLLSGDTLFWESVGRSDFVTGSGAALGRSLREKVMVLPEETIVYPGHGDSTTIGHEKRYNPFCQ